MEHKPIYLDGVDVSECIYLYSRWPNSLPHEACGLFHSDSPYDDDNRYLCKYNPDCYFKQLACKTQECEKYEQAFDSIVATIKDLENENIVTFPDFSLKENCKIIMGQCNEGYRQIINIINKVKEE